MSLPPSSGSSPAPMVDVKPRSAGVSGQMLTTRDLFGAEPEVLIQHGDETYRLRITRTGKLILTK